MRRKIVLIKVPDSVRKVIESPNARSVAEAKTAEYSIKRIDFKLCNPVSNGIYFKSN